MLIYHVGNSVSEPDAKVPLTLKQRESGAIKRYVVESNEISTVGAIVTNTQIHHIYALNPLDTTNAAPAAPQKRV